MKWKKKTKNFALASLPYPVFVCFSEDLVPVTNRRCLCELAKQIGFTDSVTNAYNVQECLAVFRHLVSLQIYFFRSYLFDCLLMWAFLVLYHKHIDKFYIIYFFILRQVYWMFSAAWLSPWGTHGGTGLEAFLLTRALCLPGLRPRLPGLRPAGVVGLVRGQRLCRRPAWVFWLGC